MRPDMRAVQKDGAHADETPILNGAAVDHRRMADRDLVTDRCCVRIFHNVNHGAILHVRSAPDPDLMDIATNDDCHPDAALFADLDVTDHLGALVDVSARMDTGHSSAVGPEHWCWIIGAERSRERVRWQAEVDPGGLRLAVKK